MDKKELDSWTFTILSHVAKNLNTLDAYILGSKVTALISNPKSTYQISNVLTTNLSNKGYLKRLAQNGYKERYLYDLCNGLQAIKKASQCSQKTKNYSVDQHEHWLLEAVGYFNKIYIMDPISQVLQNSKNLTFAEAKLLAETISS